MASATTQLESALRESLLNLLHDRARGLEHSVDVERAIASVLASVHCTVAEFSSESNRIRPPGSWYKLPVELRLETARWLAPAQRAKMLHVSKDVRKTLISEASLWTTIALPKYYVSIAARSAYLYDMLARSGNRPLDLEWKMARSYASGSLDELSTAVLHATTRARTLAINAKYVDSRPDTIWTNTMPLLEKLVVTSDGFSSSCTVSSTAWSGAKGPILRDIRLLATVLSGAPVEPFRSVVHFEATVASSASDGSWDTPWAWFPQLECLVLRVLSREPPALPPPPDSLRRVALHGSHGLPAPGRLVQNWKTHNVQVLEIFSSAASALEEAIQYLRQCAAVPWTATFVQACYPSHRACGKATLRADNKTAIVWSESSLHLREQLRVARENKNLAGPLRELTLDDVGSVHGIFALPNLHALTIIDSGIGMRFALNPGRYIHLQTHKLRQLVVDLTSAERAQDLFGYIHQFISRILIIKFGPRLLEVTVRLLDSFDRQSPELADMTKKLASTVRSIRVDYIACAGAHDESCPQAEMHE